MPSSSAWPQHALREKEVPGEPSLCGTCRFATIVKGQRLRDEIVECSRLTDHSRITFAVTFCTGYADRRLPSIREMEEIAWVPRSERGC